MSEDSLSYYRSGLALLRHVEARQPTNRRFGAEADALWRRFQGDLTAADRIDLLLRDADAQWPGAFGARTVFNLRGVAEDESFGPEWKSLDGVDAEELWRAEAAADLVGLRGVLAAIARAWQLSLESVSVEAVGAAERLVVAGPSVVAALIELFEGDEALDWSEQVLVVATPAGHRQLAAAAGAILKSTKAGRLVDSAGEPDEGAGARAGWGKGVKARLVLSPDAAADDAGRARALAGVA